MSEPDSAPGPDSAPSSPQGQMGVQKRFSGLLLLSLGLSFGSVLLLGYPIGMMLLGVGPILAGVFAWLGRRKALADPSLIGPRFAVCCLGIAVISLLFQGYIIYRGYPIKAFWDEVLQSQRAFLDNLKSRDYGKIYESMAPSYRESHVEADVEAMLAAAFPGDEAIEFEKAEIRQDDLDEEEFRERGEEFLGKKNGEFQFLWPLVFKLKDANVHLDFTMKVTRSGHAEFSAEILDFRAERKPPDAAGDAEKPDEPPAAPEKPGDEPPSEEGGD